MSEPRPLLEMLDAAGLHVGGRVNARMVARLSLPAIVAFREQAQLVSALRTIGRERGAHTHAATVALGGGRGPCAALRCRRRRAYDLAQFAALYSDAVYIENFLSNGCAVATEDVGDARADFLDDLRVLARLRPLIEAGRIVPVSPEGDVCVSCVVNDAFGTKADSRYTKALRDLKREYLRTIRMCVWRDESGLSLKISGPRRLLEHGERINIAADTLLPADAEFLKRVDAGEIVELPRNKIGMVGMHKVLAREAMDSVLFEMMMSSAVGASYLCDTDLSVELLSSISGDPEVGRRNSLIQKHLTLLVPFVGDLEIRDLLALRERHGEEFHAFRASINHAVDHVRKQRQGFEEKDAAGIYSDIVRPRLNALTVRVKQQRTQATADVAWSAAGVVGAIGFGMFTGLLDTQMLEAAKAFGVAKFAADTIKAVGLGNTPERQLMTDDLFFLWKARQKINPST